MRHCLCILVPRKQFLEVYHAYRTMENNGDRIADRKMIYAVFGLAASMLCIMGYYPVVPAFYTACCLDKKRNFLLYIGLVVGMGWCMPVAAIVKYLFILLCWESQSGFIYGQTGAAADGRQE